MTTYPILFGEAARRWLVQQVAHYSRVFVLVDSNTRVHCLPLLISCLPSDGYECIEIGAGEQHKHIGTCTKIWSALLAAQADRKSLLLNVGGGVIGDMGGFCAATYKRGIDFIQIPTTLLAQVDASVGGKLGIDFQGVKNAIGLFANPQAVLIDTDFLQTLPYTELRSGYAEILKHALIAQAAQWTELRQLTNLRRVDWGELVDNSLAVKRQIVDQDPFEKGIRKALNFGHTIGHALESWYLNTDRPLLHGEAVAVGMVCEAWLSHQLVGLPQNQLDEITAHLIGIFGKVYLPPQAIATCLSLMRNDKKNDGACINFTLLPCIGEVVVNATASDALIAESMAYYQRCTV